MMYDVLSSIYSTQNVSGKETICATCGKTFRRTQEWVYKLFNSETGKYDWFDRYG